MQLQDRYGELLVSLRAPISSQAGSYRSDAPVAAAYEAEVLETLGLSGLPVLPAEQQLPLSAAGVSGLVRDNFRSMASTHGAPAAAALDAGFAALRALTELAYLETCSSASLSHGVTVDAAATFSHTERSSGSGSSSSGGAAPQHWFAYRLRVTNGNSFPVRILGRSWVVTNAGGELEGFVVPADNAVVGQRPLLLPGGCFEYTSCTPLRKLGPGPGFMQGELLLELYEHGTTGPPSSRASVPVEPFKLQTPEIAAAAAAHARTPSSSSQSSCDSGQLQQPLQ